MLELLPARSSSEKLRVLCLGAHPDDIEIGCGGTLLSLLDGQRPLEVRWLVFSGNDRRAREARESAERLMAGTAALEVDVLGFRDGFFPDRWAEIKEAFERLKRDPGPDLVFTHRGADRHQDHRVVSELTWQTFRDHLILEYEIPKYEGDLGQPNVYVPLPEETARRKARHLSEAFPSQTEKPWFTGDTFLGLSRLRGLECSSEGGHAEAFHGRKIVAGWGVLPPSGGSGGG